MPPFGHGGPPELRARLDSELRERIEEAIDFACLEALVRSRRARGLPAPAADSSDDREEFARSVRELLARLDADIADGLSGRRETAREAPDLVAVQVRLAKELPDYWQRFEAIVASYAGEPAASGGERRSFLERLFRR